MIITNLAVFGIHMRAGVLRLIETALGVSADDVIAKPAVPIDAASAWQGNALMANQI